MYLGKVVEMSDRKTLFESPQHPYTRALIAANPESGLGKKRLQKILQGEVPSPVNPPSGCAFHPRCSFAVPSCSQNIQKLSLVIDTPPVWVACQRVQQKEI